MGKFTINRIELFNYAGRKTAMGEWLSQRVYSNSNAAITKATQMFKSKKILYVEVLKELPDGSLEPIFKKGDENADVYKYPS